MKLLLLMGTLILASTTKAAFEPGGKSHFQLGREQVQMTTGLALKLQQVDDALSNHKTQSQLKVRFDLGLDLNEFVHLQVSPRFVNTNGHVQTDSATTGKSSTFEVSEAIVRLHKNQIMAIEAGAINQAKLFNRLLVDDLAFPGLLASTTLDWSEHNSFGFLALSAVPSSSTLTSNSRDYEKAPQFQAAGFFIKSFLLSTKLEAHLNHFQYQHLPSGVATDSILLGNSSTSPLASSLYDFSYDYQGIEAGVTTITEVSRRLWIGYEGGVIKNSSAPEELSLGYSSKILARITAERLTWIPFYQFSHIEPDASVAYYAAEQTNQAGYVAGLGIQYKNIFKVNFSGGERDVLFENSTQSRERLVSISLETLDAAL